MDIMELKNPFVGETVETLLVIVSDQVSRSSLYPALLFAPRAVAYIDRADVTS